jgi:N-acetylglutamate synthase
MPVSPADVGRRVTLRRMLPRSGAADASGRQLYADVVGHLEAWHGDMLVVRRRDGTRVEVDATTLVAGHVVPPAPSRRSGSPISVAELAEIAGLGWRPTEQTWLGRWWLRAAGGFTGRANAVLPLGDPGVPLAGALSTVRTWYGARQLPARIQVEPGCPLDVELAALGWTTDDTRGGVLVQTAETDAAIVRGEDRAPNAPVGTGRPRSDVTIEPQPPAGWLALYRGPGQLPPAAIRVLGEHPQVGFAIAREGGHLVAGGRGAIDRGWLGISGVEVVLHRRRVGLGLAVVRKLLRWARANDAERAYLQVQAKNAAAVSLYAQLGFVTHHHYHYRLAPDGDL